MNCVLLPKTDQVFSFKKKLLDKWKKYWKKSENFVSPEKWEPFQYIEIVWNLFVSDVAFGRCE